MTQREYFQAYVRQVGGTSKAADRLGLSVSLVRSIVNGHRGISPVTALRVEQDSNGEFQKERLLWGDAA